MIHKIVLLLFFTVPQGNSLCISSTFLATTSAKGLDYSHYSDNDNCTVNIIPNALYQRGFYLEIKWTRFHIEGDMPKCKDYVEVFLTRHQRTIGKYCSDNTHSLTLFNMYSSDGYAMLRFKSDSRTTKGGFTLTYRLKRYTYYTGEYGTGQCLYLPTSYHTAMHHGLFYSSGWPKGYNKSDGYCYHAFTLSKGKEIRISVMDLDLHKDSDYFQIRASTYYFTVYKTVLKYTKQVTQEYGGTHLPMFFTFRDQHVYAIVNKPMGSQPNTPSRGFMIGYIIYDADVASDSIKVPETGCGHMSGFVDWKAFWLAVGIGMTIQYLFA